MKKERLAEKATKEIFYANESDVFKIVYQNNTSTDNTKYQCQNNGSLKCSIDVISIEHFNEPLFWH